MSRIQSSVGLITGLPILDTVDKLMAISARPRDLLDARNQDLQAQQLALSQVASLLLGVRFEISKFKSSKIFQSRQATSSNSEALSATVRQDATPPAGRYSFTPIQTASAQQLLSGPVGAGVPARGLPGFTIAFGGFLDTGVELARLGGGEGVAPGQIRIRDRSGASGVIDLRFARTIDDVLKAINSSAEIDVTASTRGDRIQLVDNTGLELSNLVVQEISGGTTAADLGLSGINVAAGAATGQDILRLHDDTRLADLNDGNGVLLRDGTSDLTITLRDGGTLQIDLGAATTLGQVVAALNAVDPTKLEAAISADGDRLVLTDLTAGAGSFSIESAVGGRAAEDLGLDQAALGGTLTSRRLQAGLKTTLLASLNGGQGIGPLGTIELTDRSGNSALVDLATAETVDDVLDAINSAGVGIRASVSASRGGIQLADISGGAASNLIVASADASQTAEKLGIVFDAAAASVESRSLSRQTVSHATRLQDFAGGVALGSFIIRDSAGNEGAVRLNTPGSPVTTLGGVIDAINSLDIDVEARINDRGDGLLLIDRAGGSGQLSVRDVGSGTAAADLRLTRAAKLTDVGGEQLLAIDGTTRETISIARHLSLASLGTSGVQLGTFTIRDSTGKTATVALDVAGSEARTLGDVIDAINAADVAVQARVNDAGTGLLLVDRGSGNTSLEVTNGPGKTTASDLGIAGTGVPGEEPATQVIDGAGKFDSTRVDAQAMARLVADINGRHAGIAATTIFDGTTHRLSLTSEQTGTGRELLVDSPTSALKFTEVAQGQDSLVYFGVGTEGGVLLSSKTNELKNVVEGVDLTVKAPSLAPIAIDVFASDSAVVEAAKQFVAAYNSLRDTLGKLTSFDADAGTSGTLFGTREALRVDSDLSRLVSQRFRGLGRFESLQQVGIELNDKGKLVLNEARLKEAFAEDPAALANFFTDAERGVAVQFEALIDQLAGEKGSLLTFSTESIRHKVESNTRRIDLLDKRLESERARLLKQFFAMEEVVARMQSHLAAIQGIQAIPPLSIG